MGHINIEIKARCKNHEKIRKILQSRNADFSGTDHQIDTYFNASAGRLKLREGNIENSLIFYERENTAGPKQSNIVLYKSTPASSLKTILTKGCGILTVVDKNREIFFIKNIKFHLDTVKGLGTFVEIEAIDKDGNIGKEKLLLQCTEYMKLFGITDSDLISTSYSNMMLEM